MAEKTTDRKKKYSNAINKSYKRENIFGTNLASLRNSHKLTQKELAEAISEQMVLEEEISSLTISSYECGRRYPSILTLIAFAEYFEVSLDWLVGISPDASIKNTKKEEISDQEFLKIDYDLEIRPQDLVNYNKEPVYVKGKGGANFKGRWGILDYTEEHQWVLFADGFLQLPAKVSFYRARPVAAERMAEMNIHPLSYTALAKEGIAYLVPLTTDYATAEWLRGYYTFDKKNSVMVNKENGTVLPLTGLGKSYVAYSVNPRI